MIKEKDLEDYLINTPAFRYNKSIALAMCVKFQLDGSRVHEGWSKIENQNVRNQNTKIPTKGGKND